MEEGPTLLLISELYSAIPMLGSKLYGAVIKRHSHFATRQRIKQEINNDNESCTHHKSIKDNIAIGIQKQEYCSA